MKEIVLIAPYDNLYRLSKELIAQRGDKNIDIIYGDLREGLHVANQSIESGAKVLISRGGTFTLILETLNVPVVEIKASAYDMLFNIRHVIKQNSPIAIVGYDNVIHGYELLSEIFPNIKKVNISHGEVVSAKILECVEEGITVFAGDAVVYNACLKLDYECYMLESGRNSIIDAIEEANRILIASNMESERAKRYMALVDYVHDGVIATDEQNRLLLYNLVAQEILGVPREDALGRKVEELGVVDTAIAEIAASKPLIDEVRSLNGTQVTISNIPIEVSGETKGTVVIFQDVAKLQNLEQRVRVKLAEKGFIAKNTFDSIIYKSDAVGNCISIARKFSSYDSCVLIEGESGVGKELFAQSIHNESRHRSGPFVAINCAALPTSLIESELFGYAEGAFTGSKKGGKAGVFELAHKGTIFLDEISELAIDLQGRLLRVIQEREVMRIGDDKMIPLDVRVICAANRDLLEMVKDGTFRRDLLYRINTLSLYIPPLRDRKDDVHTLAGVFLKRYSRRYSKNINSFTSSALQYLMDYNYEGNIRELKGMVERAVIISDNEFIRLVDLSGGRPSNPPKKSTSPNFDNSLFADLPDLAQLEIRYIQSIYEKTGHSTEESCRILKINRTTLWRKLKNVQQ